MYVLLDLIERALGVDEVVVEDLLQLLEGVPGLLLEHAVAALGERLVEIRGALLEQRADPGAAHLLVVRAHLDAARSWRATLVASSTKSTMMWIVGWRKWMPSGFP
jgi:hypothetical protein